MVVFTECSLVVQNLTNKELGIFGTYRLRRGPVDLFKEIPDLTESHVINALKAPGGELYNLVKVKRVIEITRINLSVWDNVSVGADAIRAVNRPVNGDVLSYSDDGLQWIRPAGGSEVALPAPEFPLVLAGDRLGIAKAGPESGGYLSREDWLRFANRLDGVRIWRKVDLSAGEAHYTIPADVGVVVSGSAVVVSTDGRKAPGVWWRRDPLLVTSHVGDTVTFNRAVREDCALYYLVVLGSGDGVPAGYEGAPEYVRKLRSEYLDTQDLGNASAEQIRGRKVFAADVIMSDLRVNDTFAYPPGADTGLVMTSNGVGEGSWCASPVVSLGPPANPYRGQLWVRQSDFRLFIYSGVWMSVAERRISGGVDQLCGGTYLAAIGSGLITAPGRIVHIAAVGRCAGHWTGEVHINGRPVGSVSGGNWAELDVSVVPGDLVSFYINGSGVDCPRVEVVLKDCI